MQDMVLPSGYLNKLKVCSFPSSQGNMAIFQHRTSSFTNSLNNRLITCIEPRQVKTSELPNHSSSSTANLLKMRMPTIILLLLSASGSALAAPSNSNASPTTGPFVPPVKPKVTPWTVKSYTRTCNGTSCAVSFWIDTNTGEEAQYCSFTIASANSSISKISCGKDWIINSSWSGRRQGRGLTTLSLYNSKQGFVSWPKYFDLEIANGVPVTPNKVTAPDWY